MSEADFRKIDDKLASMGVPIHNADGYDLKLKEMPEGMPAEVKEQQIMLAFDSVREILDNLKPHELDGVVFGVINAEGVTNLLTVGRAQQIVTEALLQLLTAEITPWPPEDDSAE